MSKKYCFIVIFLLLQCCGFAQLLPDSAYVDIAAINDSSRAYSKTLFFIDSNHTATINNITRQQFVPVTAKWYKSFIPARLVAKPIYLQVAVWNSANKNDTILFLPGSMFDKIKFYVQEADGTLQYAGDGSAPGWCTFTLGPKEKKIYLLQLSFCRQEYNLLRPQFIRPNYLVSYESIYRRKIEDIRNVGFLLGGVLLMMIIFIVVNYTLTRKKEFLYYLGYAVSMFGLVFFYALLGTTWGAFTSFFNGYLDLLLLSIGNVFYLAFSRYFLNTRQHYTLLDKVFKTGEWFLLFLILVFTFIHYFTEWYWIETALENLTKILMLGIGILFIVIAFKQKQRLIIYLAVGSALSIVFNLVSLALILFKVPSNSIFSRALFYHDMGLVCALSFFLLGLTYKNRRELVERTQEQEALKLDVEKKVLENQIAIIKAQQEERNRISADMHDDLGAGMTTIRLYSELAKSRLKDQPIPEIEKISSSANELLNKMNAIIWSMSSSNDSLGNMVAYIRSYSLEYFENSGINCRIFLPEDIPSLVVSGEIRRNVFLVVKEALNNILKHSKATEVVITLEQVTDGLKLYIHDNGTGIDFEKLRQFGNGLKNMKKRMADINVGFTIENRNGTLITLHGVVS